MPNGACYSAGTDPEAPKHRGITCFLLDMQTPGITIRPLVQMTGDAEFNQVFFDQVRIPKSRLLGTLNEGWRVAVSTLSHERGGIRQFMRLHRLVRMVEDLARQRGVSADPLVRQQLAKIHIDTEVQRLTVLRALTRQLRGAARARGLDPKTVVCSDLHASGAKSPSAFWDPIPSSTKGRVMLLPMGTGPSRASLRGATVLLAARIKFSSTLLANGN